MGGCLLAEHGTVVALLYYSSVALVALLYYSIVAPVAPPYHGTVALPLPQEPLTPSSHSLLSVSVTHDQGSLPSLLLPPHLSETLL